jgi:hypothetical protein
MSEGVRLISRIVTSVRALLPTDWFGRAGRKFSEVTEAISEFASEHDITPKDLLEDGVDLGRRKLEGLANHEYANALKDFADAEQKKIESEFQRRALETKLRREEVQLQKDQAEAHLARIKAVDAEVDLLRKLKEIGVVLHRDDHGNLSALPSGPTIDLLELTDRRRSEEHSGQRETT